MTKRIFCYVDETGQDAGSKFFIISVLLFESNRDLAITDCEEAEKTSGKGPVKWIKTSFDKRLDYVRAILKYRTLKDRLFYRHFPKSKSIRECTVDAVSECIKAKINDPDYKATILVDGLPRAAWEQFGQDLHARGN